MFRFLKLAYWLLHLLILVCFIVIVISVLYFIHGSFEDFPTKEDHAKARMVSTFLFNFFLLLEVFFFRIRSGMKRIIETQNIPDHKRLLAFVLQILLMILVPVILLYLILHLIHIFDLNYSLDFYSSGFRYLVITAIYWLCLFVTTFLLKRSFKKEKLKRR